MNGESLVIAFINIHPISIVSTYSSKLQGRNLVHANINPTSLCLESIQYSQNSSLRLDSITNLNQHDKNDEFNTFPGVDQCLSSCQGLKHNKIRPQTGDMVKFYSHT